MSAGQTTRECGPGVTLGHYEIREKIGAGGMGEVFRAYDQHLERDVAIKVLPPGTLGDESARKRFHKEALALSRLNHPNIATIHDFDTQQGVDFLVMEYIPGITLSEVAAPLPEKEIVALGTQLAEGLTAAHAHGVIHRDLKPGNLRLTDDGRLKILDFGLAKLRAPVIPNAVTASVSATQAVAGTLPYMAPEQLLGGLIDARTDIHAAGAVLYEMSTGAQPFAGVEPSRLIGAILNDAPRPVSRLNPRVPPEIARVIEKCLEKDPDCRYQSAKELLVDLRRSALHEAPLAGESGKGISGGREPKKILAFAAISLILLVAAAVFVARMRRSSDAIRFSPSIAVLPFVDLSAERNQEYFSDGLAEELLNHLTKLPGVRVAARTSAFQFKGKNEDLQVIGRRLGVGSVLEGSVQRSGNRVRISVHLIRVDTAQSLWSESYDRESQDIFAVEDDIAAAVTAALRPQFLGQTSATSKVSQTTSPEAYQAFLQARSLIRTSDVELESKAFEYADRAIQLDPTYAPAYALRSVMSAEAGLMGRRNLEAAMERSRADADKAIALDPNLAAGYRARSETQAMADWNWQAAQESVNQARKLAPGDADILGQCAFLARAQGRMEEAIGLTRQVIELDPLRPGPYAELGHLLRDQGRYDEAHAAFAKALDVGPDQVWVREARGEVYLAQGRSQEGLSEMESEPAGPWRDFGLALAYDALGRGSDSDAALKRLISQHQSNAAYQIAEVYAYRGNTEQAFHWLDRACQQKDGGLAHLKSDWLMKSLRPDPRYAQVLRRVHLPQ